MSEPVVIQMALTTRVFLKCSLSSLVDEDCTFSPSSYTPLNAVGENPLLCLSILSCDSRAPAYITWLSHMTWLRLYDLA